MTRITATTGNRTLIQISDDLWISQCFIERDLITQQSIEQNCKRDDYQLSILLAEYKSEIINKQFRRWNIDDEYFTVFEDGTFYNSEELQKLSKNKIDDKTFKQLHLVKNIFRGDVVDIKALLQESGTQEELIF